MNPIEARFEKWYREEVSPHIDFTPEAISLLRHAFAAGAASTIDRISEETFKPQTSKVNQ